ncbi:sce7726 family protein [Sinorhizobium terangae]|uniref:sce7726 family protein n=1 Tax=Sinorhizobium terangae TaxID=110322 RepID=UPI0024B20521|nr:sce7726 family protein [Sinorhizobium terangae]WFU49652.1 sce7726 family protein [Sinorhizobium terangae]
MQHTTTDATIRQAVRASLEIAHRGEDAVIVDELKVSLGSGRMDVAVINGKIEGYEIKSDRDSLNRLARQSVMFGAIADRMTLVVGRRHLEKASAIIPDWWSIVVCAADADGNLKLKRVRRGRLNRELDKTALVETLERDEIVALLASAQLDKGVRSANYRTLVERAVANLSCRQISSFVKKILKVRARLEREFDDLAFGRSVIVCGGPSATSAD